MSLLASFDLSTRALRAFQVAIQTISHNISNVNTPGYSRQRVLYSTENSDFDGRFHVGRGVQVEGVERLRTGRGGERRGQYADDYVVNRLTAAALFARRRGFFYSIFVQKVTFIS